MVTPEQIKAKIEEAKTNPATARELQKRLETGIYDAQLSELGIARTNMGLKPIAQTKTFGDIGQDIIGIGKDIAENSFKRNANIQEIRSAMNSGEQGDIRSILQTSGQLAGAGADAIGAVAKGAFNALIPQTAEERITKGVSNVVGKTKLPELMQKYEQLKQTNPVLARDIDAALGLTSLAAEFVGLDVAKRSANLVGTGVKKSVDEIASGISEVTGGAKSTTKLATDLAKDVTPTAAGLRDRAVAGGLRFAPSDISTFKQISGGTEDIGEFMSRNKLIMDTPEETADSLVKFKKRNYELTRDAIALDDNKYTFADIPELETTIDFLINDLSKTKSPEYQNVLSQLQNIKNAGEFDLLQAQYVKNVFDDIESVYKRTGEVREAIMAEDKALTIQPVRRFIEDRVSENYPQIDIRGLNRNVQLSSEILDSIAKRAPKADTASILRLGDYATLGVGNQVLPGAGFAALFTKKIVESAPVKLRFARLMARRAEKQALKKGEALKGLTPAQVDEMSSLVEKELRKAIEMNDSTAAKEIQAIKAQIQSEKAITTSINNSAKTNSISDTIPQTSKKVKGEIPSKLKNSQAGFIATGYKGESDLTTKILKDLEGKTTVSKQYILDATNRGELKQVERDLIRDILERETRGISNNIKTIDAPIKVFRGEGKGIGNSTLVNGQYFADSKKFASTFGKVTEEVIPKGAKIFDLDLVKNGKGSIPQEMLVDQKALTKYLIDNGVDYTKNTNTRGVEYVKLNKIASELEDLAGKSKSLDDFKSKVMKNYDKYRPELTRLSKNYTNADSSRLRSPIEDIYRRVEKDGIPKSYNTDTINVSDFAKKVKAELLPLKVKTTSNPKGSDPKFFREQTRGDAQYGGARMQPRYEMVNLPDELRGNVKNYRENIYESPIKTSAGETHFGGKTDNYFGHTRIEDMADNKTRRVIEVQSDLYQKGNLEKEINTYKKGDKIKLKDGTTKTVDSVSKDDGGLFYRTNDNGSEDYIRESRIVSGQKQSAKLQQYNDPTAHFRMIREEIKKAAQDGKTKLQFPTGETAMKIEGLGQGQAEIFNQIGKDGRSLRVLTPDVLKVGGEIEGNGGRWIITDILGDGKFKAVPKDTIMSMEDELVELGYSSPDDIDFSTKEVKDLMNNLYDVESFDISGKVDTNNPIYKFYEKEVQKYLNKFGGKRVVDDKGVSWIEVPIKKEYGKAPVEAFGKSTPNVLLWGAGIGLAGAVGAGQIKKRKK